MVLINAGLLKNEKDEMEKVQVTNDYFNKIKFIEFFLFYYGWFGIACALVEYELRYIAEQNNTLTAKVQNKLFILLTINSFCTACLVVCIFVRYSLILNWKIAKK